MTPRRGFLASILLTLAAGCAASNGNAGAGAGSLPACSGDVVAVAAGGATEISRETLIRLGAIEDNSGGRLVAASGLPELLNPREFQRHLARQYPAELRSRNAGGRAVYAVRIDRDGAVADVRVIESAGHDGLDRGGAEALRHARFSASVAEGCRAPMWMRLPLTFRSEG